MGGRRPSRVWMKGFGALHPKPCESLVGASGVIRVQGSGFRAVLGLGQVYCLLFTGLKV